MGVPRQSPGVLKRPAQLGPDSTHSRPDLSGFIFLHARARQVVCSRDPADSVSPGLAASTRALPVYASPHAEAKGILKTALSSHCAPNTRSHPLFYFLRGT